MANWFTDTFSSDAKEEDIVKSRSLNITRITGVVVPILAGIATAIGEVADRPPFSDVDFQKQLIIALVLLVGVVTVADILGRSLASLGSSLSAGAKSIGGGIGRSRDLGVATPLPVPLPCKKILPNVLDEPGHIVAFRASNSSNPIKSGAYLFVPEKEGNAPTWQSAESLDFG